MRLILLETNLFFTASGRIEGYERSADVGKLKADGTYESSINNGRTSTNAWCQHDCYKDEVALAVVERLSNITGINETNSEYLQLLRYEEGQRYQVRSSGFDEATHRLLTPWNTVSTPR